MSKTIHRIYVWSMVMITVGVTLYLAYTGYSYYSTPVEERFYHPRHAWFKPSGLFGHGLGFIGTFLILFGVIVYIARKRYGFLERYIRLKYLLEFHIFLCTIGPIMVLFHTAFKFGGIVSVAFWSMVAVVLSGVIGRFIYIQIPRTIEGRALSMNEVKLLRAALANKLTRDYKLDSELVNRVVLAGSSRDSKGYIENYFKDRKQIRMFAKALKKYALSNEQRKEVLDTVKEEISLSHKMQRLELMKNLFKYWHVAHLPFALVMLIIVIIHVGVALALGYKWIF